MEEELLFKAVEDGRCNEVFITDALHGQVSVKAVGQDKQDHRDGVRQIREYEIRQECMGLSAGTLYAGDFQAERFRLPVREDDKVSFIGSSFTAGSFCTAVRADDEKQRGLFQRLTV
ncbi:MAG: hypothetical protein NC312_12470 [Bacteroides fragilis]|nr:hypothetical protein [Bacteroides fragilis]